MNNFELLSRAQRYWHVLFGLFVLVFTAYVWVKRAPISEHLVAQERSLYRNVFVTEFDGIRCLQFERVTRLKQSCVDTINPERLFIDYTRATLLAGAIVDSPSRALFLGLGSGTIPNAYLRIFPKMKADVVELDSAVVAAASQHFGFPVDESRTSVSVSDARLFVRQAIKSNARYDVIVLDVFDENHIPEHLMTIEFMQELSTLLSNGGVLIANTFSPAGLYELQLATIQAVFSKVFSYQSEANLTPSRQAASRVLFALHGAIEPAARILDRADTLAAALLKIGVDVHLLLALTSFTEKSRSESVLTDKISGANARLWSQSQSQSR
jgi:spermidine synthase